jgi:hypothetical protein
MAYCEGFRACFIKEWTRDLVGDARPYQGYQSQTARQGMVAAMLDGRREDQENFIYEDGARDSFYGVDGCDERVLRAGAWPEAGLEREGMEGVRRGRREDCAALRTGIAWTQGPKIAFYADDVTAMREKLVARGAKFGKVRQWDELFLCDGKDPDGNPVQLSNR